MNNAGQANGNARLFGVVQAIPSFMRARIVISR